jgi:glycogen(starch) synthase
MRILITTDVLGGVWRYTITLVRELVRDGHTCAIAVIGSPDAERLESVPDGVEVFHEDLRLEWMPDGMEDVAAGTAWLEALARDWSPDLIHLNQFAYAVGSFAAPVLVVAHSDVLSWYEEVRGRPAPDGWRPYVDAVRAGIEAADAVAAPTAYQSGRLARHYGRTAVRVIHNGTDPPAPEPDVPPASERSLVLVAGRAWDDAKGIDLLDRAVAELGEGAPPVHLVGPVEGPAGEEIQVENLVTHGEVDGAVMHRFYNNAILYVGPSLYEPFGLSPLEAAGHGCALLLSGIGSFRELWTGVAEFFEPIHADVLAHRMTAVLGDPEALDALAARGRERALERYTADRMAQGYEKLYRELTLAASGPPVRVPGYPGSR